MLYQFNHDIEDDVWIALISIYNQSDPKMDIINFMCINFNDLLNLLQLMSD